MTQPLRFDGRVALVTGAGRGLGPAHALTLAARGARVVVNDLGTSLDGAGADTALAQGVVAEITSAGGVAVGDTNDVASAEGSEALVALALNRFERLDIVISNAGFVRVRRFPDIDSAELQHHLDVHLGGAFNVTRAAWPHMRRGGYGRVVLTSSSAVVGDPLVVAYSAAKASLMGLTRSLALTGASEGILVNAVAPSATTRMSGVAAPEDPATSTRVSVHLAPERASAMVAYLAHESCSATGELYSAGGGHASRVFTAASTGYFTPELSPEDVASHWEEINDTAAWLLPLSMYDYVERIRALMTPRAPRPSSS